MTPEIFDRVVVRSEAGEAATYSTQEFLALPLNIRIQHILSRAAKFYLRNAEVERGDALKSLRR